VPRGLSVYVSGRSPLHSAHPFTKGVLTLTSIALAFIAPSLPWVIGIGGVLLILMAIAGVIRRFVVLALALLLPLTLLLLIVQGLVNPANRTVLVPLGPLSLYREGISIAILTAARLADLIAATFLFSFTTKPADLAEALIQRGLSPRIGYVVQSALQIIPQTLETADRIRDAQRARGLETEGPIVKRARAFLPLLLPVVLSSLVATEERAMALEVRGFGLRGRREARYVVPDSMGQRALRWTLVLLVPLALIARIAGWH
jgi:energy-coupling factor transport system permease protein